MEDTITRLVERVTRLEQLLRIFPDPSSFAGAKPQRIIHGVATLFDLLPATLVGPVRTERLTWPRHICMHLIYNHCDIGLYDVARIFHRHHTSVHYARKHVANRMATDPTARNQVQFLESQLDGNLRKSA